ncbi:MAG: hypothetical protein R3F37_13595 [Candidatus Competibacteraceae bacterium]
MLTTENGYGCQKEKLDSWINKNVSDFCSSSATSHTDDKNLHCAHFVSHCLNLHRVRSNGKTGHFETGVGKIAKQCFNACKIDAKGKIEVGCAARWTQAGLRRQARKIPG